MYKTLPILLVCSVSLTSCSVFQQDEVKEEPLQIEYAQKKATNILYLHEQMGTRSGQDTFKSIVSKANVIVDFYADWCGPCKSLGRTIEQIANSYPTITFLKVDVDQFPQIAQAFGVKSIPVLSFYKDGVKVKQIAGAKNKNELESLIRSMY